MAKWKTHQEIICSGMENVRLNLKPNLLYVFLGQTKRFCNIFFFLRFM